MEYNCCVQNNVHTFNTTNVKLTNHFSIKIFLANVKFMFAICHHTYVCNVCAPYSGNWNFRQCFYAIWYDGIWYDFTEIVPGEPLRQGS